MRSGRRGTGVLVSLSLLAPLAVLVAVWVPHFAHYYVASDRVTAIMLEESRRAPDDGRLRELADFTSGYLIARPVLELSNPVPAANQLLQGLVDVPGLPRIRISLPFSADDIDRDGDRWQLDFAGLTLVELLLRAYAQTKEDRYLLAARDMVVGWATYERTVWRPRGFLWNDHAVAARIPVLGRFWLAYRRHPAFDPAVAAIVLQFASRSAAFLARPDHFTVHSNHGVMQNLALWHYALAFPMLPGAMGYESIAYTRFGEQMGFYINDEGVILEHSAGYHRDGLELLGLAFRYLDLLRIPAPASWVQKYDRALSFYAEVRRPDGSLPMFGDTSDGADPVGPLTPRLRADGHRDPPAPRADWPPPGPNALYRVAGYSVWWHGLQGWPDPAGLSQTVVAWSYFLGHGHKHADELSVHIWAGGRSWLTGVGYWPYAVRGRSQVEAWSGSNAPHLVDESPRSFRSTRLLSHGWSEQVAALDLERRLVGGYVVRRQVTYAAPGVWVVTDRVVGAPSGVSRTQWAVPPDLALEATGAGWSYRAHPNAGSQSMSLGLLASPGTSVRQIRGSFDPFGGWAVVAGTPTAADALLVDQPAGDSWTIAVWCLEGVSSRMSTCPRESPSGRFSDDEEWTVSVATRPNPLTIRRQGPSVRLERPGISSAPSILALQSTADTSADLLRIQRAYAAAVGRYPGFRDIGFYRLRISYGIIVMLALQEIFFAVVRPASRLFRLLAVLGWLGLGGWLTLVYLR